MQNRRRVALPLGVAFTLALAAAALLVPASPEAQSTSACASSGSKTSLASRYVRVFTKPRIVRPRYRVRRWYGCLYSRGAKIPLATVGEPGIFTTAVSEPHISRAFVGLGLEYEGPAGGNYGQIKVVNLRTGRALVNEPAAEGDEETRTTGVPDLALKANGSVAWIVAVRQDSGTVYRVVRHDLNGRAVLDSGSDIDPSSLALSSSTLYWTRAGQPHSAELR
jgi:hypothetical protein